MKFPNESQEYRDAREDLLKSEMALRDHIESTSETRRRLPLGGKIKEDYAFDSRDGRVKISELFKNPGQSLLVYNFMFGPKMDAPCPLCTAFLDSVEGHFHHISQRLNMAIVAKSPLERIQNFAGFRGWQSLPLVSSNSNSYNRDYFGEDTDGNQMPMANIFVKNADGVFHFWGSELMHERFKTGDTRHVDMLWPLWHFFDLTPEGRGEDWYPALEYKKPVSIGGND